MAQSLWQGFRVSASGVRRGLSGIQTVLQRLREAQCCSLWVTVAGNGPFFMHRSPSQRLPQLPDIIELLCNSEASAAAILKAALARPPG